jgi:hypothetical protein
MATTDTVRAMDKATSGGQGSDGKHNARRGIRVIAIAALALAFGIAGPGERGTPVAAQANAGVTVAELPADASVTTEYRWDFGE